MPTVLPAPSREQWLKYEGSSMAKQQEVLQRYEDDFEKVSVTASDSIQAGDHLVLERQYYDHHMLCIYSSDSHVIVIHYTGTAWGISRGLDVALFKDIGVKGEIMEEMYSFEDLVRRKIKKIIWPEKLKRFSVEEVTARAVNLLGENYYDILKNNCEHFVTWSICGLKASLQVKRWYLAARELGYSALTGIYDFGRKKSVPLLVKIAANVSDEIAAYICENALYVGYGIAIIIEAGWACYEIHKAFKYCKTREEFIAKLVDIVAKAACRLGFGIAGSCIGAASGPLGSLIVGAIGAGLGHLFGAMIGWWYENCHYVDG